MKKGDRVPVLAGAYVPQAHINSWTEKNLYGAVKLPAGTELYHVSEMGKLEAFAPIETCWNLEPGMTYGYVYMMVLKKDLIFEKFDNCDYRIDLSSLDEDDIDIVYLGTMDVDYSRFAVVDKFGRVDALPKKYNFAKQYKELEKEFTALYTEKIIQEYQDSYHIRLGWHVVDATKIYKK